MNRLIRIILPALLIAILPYVSSAAPSYADRTAFDSENFPAGTAPFLRFTDLAQDSITGRIFSDLNNNGTDDTEAGLSGWTVELHQDSAGGPLVTSASTGADGSYKLSVDPGTYYLNQVIQGGWRRTTPIAGYYTVVVADSLSPFSNYSFGNFRLGTLSVELTTDLNGDGTRNANDTTALAGDFAAIFLTKLDNVELYSDTITTGMKGFTHAYLDVGTYTIEQTGAPAGWVETFGGIQSRTISTGGFADTARFLDFKLMTVSGTKFNDLNGDGDKDAGEPGLSGWTIDITGTGGGSTVTGGTGAYAFTGIGPGAHTVSETGQADWTQTMPSAPGTHSITPISGSSIAGKDFGNFNNITVSGYVFSDSNGDGVKDGGEAGLAGWTVTLTGTGGGSSVTDVNGAFSFTGVGPGSHTLSQVLEGAWVQSFPASPGTYVFTPTSGTNLADQNFGNVGSTRVAGTIFYDRDRDSTKDVDENGITGWTVVATGLNPSNTQSTTSGAGGAYEFIGLLPDTYTLTEQLETNWTQSYPPSVSYTLVVTSELDTAGFDFGNIANLDTLMYRTFSPESLYVKRAVRKSNISSKWTFPFVNETGTDVDGLVVQFSVKVDSITEVSGLSTATPDSRFRKWTFSGATIAHGESVSVLGYGGKRGQKVTRWWWTSAGVIAGGKQPKKIPQTQQLLLPRPNAANLAVAVFKLGFAPFNTTSMSPMLVGLARTDSTKKYGWVIHRKQTDLLRSLWDRNAGFHTGIPKGFKTLSGRTFLRQKTSLPPSKHNNTLFSEVAALKVSIAASAYGFTPPGLGELIFEQPSHALSGRSVASIVHHADSILTMWHVTPDIDYDSTHAIIRRINRAFLGAIDTVSWGDSLLLTGVTAVSDVPYLRPDPTIAPLVIPVAHYAEIEAVPELYTLYQNYPNPFNPATTIQFSIPEEAFVTLKVYNMLGQEVATLLDNELVADGFTEMEFLAGNLPSGVYFYRITAQGIGDEEEGIAGEQFISTKKMLLVK